jgi:murein DD-endopeptidase MepM/ murein hydrolase activator NlpD
MEIEALYQVPFDTSLNPLRISQGNNGPWSHRLLRNTLASGHVIEKDLIHAVDFALPFWTEVRAARSGKVFGAILSGTWFYEGLDPEIGNNPPPFGWTNQIIIEHDDDTRAIYSHLAAESLVEIREEIKAGQVIARTGRSGWIAQMPHLHLQICNSNFSKSLPIRFKDYQGSLDHETLLREGRIWFG